MLIGGVALLDRALPGAERALATLPVAAQLALGTVTFLVGGALFALGRRWR
jgi:hypothetical protein